MIKELLHPIAIDNNGKSIHISQAEKGNQYLCPYCKIRFIFNRSLKIGKGSRRAHFSHESLSPNCTSEGYLHSSFKLLLLEYLSSGLDNNSPIIVSFKCNHCTKMHNANLISGAISIKGEYDLQVCRPDIALLTNGKNVYAVIEVIVTHEPEEKTVNYYKDNKIILIKYKLDSYDDLQRFNEKVKYPTEVILFDKRQCPTFVAQQQMFQKNIILQKRISSQGHSGPRIDQIESQKSDSNRKQYYAIKNYYKKKKR